jgi:hypothetical protein
VENQASKRDTKGRSGPNRVNALVGGLGHADGLDVKEKPGEMVGSTGADVQKKNLAERYDGEALAVSAEVPS